jgi:hypothetical protein
MLKQVRSGRLEIITGLVVLHAKSSCPTLMAIRPGVTRWMINCNLEMMRSLMKLEFRKSLMG